MDISEINEEIQRCLNEMAPIVRDRFNKHLIKNIITTPDQGRNWYNEEYFKVFDTLDYTSKSKMARIKYREPSYVEHVGSNWQLTMREKKDLIAFLNEPNNKIPEAKTNWQYAIYQFNMSAYPDSTHADSLLTQTELDRLPDTDERKSYLPIDLPMPDYTKL